MSRTMERASGILYRLAQGSLTEADRGIWVANGVCWSPDDRVMYLADSHIQTIFAYEFDVSAGAIAARRVFARTHDRPGVPDGSCVDAEGCIWNAVFDGACLVCYAPDGRIRRTVALPVARPTACTFGGADLGVLYVTTARFRLAPEKLAAQPLAGALLALDVGVRGLPEPLYAR